MDLEGGGLARSMRWEDVKGMKLSLINMNSYEYDSCSCFRPEWEKEFRGTSSKSKKIARFGALYSIYCIIQLIFIALENTIDGSESYFGNVFVIFTWFPELISVIACLCVFMLVNFAGTTIACRFEFDQVASFVNIACYFGTLVPNLMLEIRRSRSGFKNQGTSSNQSRGFETTNRVALTIDYSTFPPTRECNNSVSFPSLLEPSLHAPLDCNNLVLSSDTYPVYVLLNLLPRIVGADTTTAVRVAVVSAVMLMAALVAVGSLPGDWALSNVSTIDCLFAATLHNKGEIVNQTFNSIYLF